MLRLLLLSSVLAVTACAAPVAEAPPLAGDVPAVTYVTEVPYEPHMESPGEPAASGGAFVAEAAGAIVRAIPLPDPVVSVPAPEPMVCAEAIELIITFEVASPEIYTRKYQVPIWPGAASGVTVGIGYDLGHTAPKVIANDWQQHPQVERLPAAAGVRGAAAKPLARSMRDVLTPYPLAHQVFLATSYVDHERRARRAFGEPFERAPACVQGGITSVVFNRGASMTGGRRAELRAIRDDCLPRDDYACVAQQIRGMTRLWQGTAIEAGMRRRREAEARLIEQARS